MRAAKHDDHGRRHSSGFGSVGIRAPLFSGFLASAYQAVQFTLYGLMLSLWH
jgi:hypothetical protein